MVFVFALASFTGAGLLFLVQPMVARMVLPLYGGSPAVWNTAVLFFEGVLMAGYAYTHATTRRLGLRRQPWIHLGILLLPLIALPIALPDWAAPREGTPPVLWLLGVLAFTVGLPFLLVSTTGPLLQRWFSGTDHPRAEDPYFLYAAGNTGSLLALLGYPLLVEPTLTLRQQGRLWSGGYVLFALLVAACALQLRRRPSRDMAGNPGAATESTAPPPQPLGWRRRAYWIALAFVPSSLMLGVTTYLSTDIAAVPMLWVLPLSLYLLTFIVAFGRPRPRALTTGTRLVCGLVLALTVVMARLVDVPTPLAVTVHLATFTAVAFVAHSRLALDRPSTEQLTEFYLLISLGGVLGGAFNGLVAPAVFTQAIEYPLVLAAALLLTLSAGRAGFLTQRYGRFGSVLEGVLPAAVLILATDVVRRDDLDRYVAVALACLGGAIALGWLASRQPRPFSLAVFGLIALTQLAPESNLFTDRTFFGVYRVYQLENLHVFKHGVTVHGWQDLGPGRRSEPLSYYSRAGPAGQVFRVYGPRPVADRVALVGLGTGALSAYGRPDQTMTVYEIDQAVVDIARDPRYFTYLSDSKAQVDYVVGDGRLELAEAAPQSFGLIVLDAFSSDAIPVHLMTAEAFALYRQKLQPDGMLLVHITNKHLDLEPVLGATAKREGLTGLVRFDQTRDETAGRLPSKWVVLSAEPRVLDPLRGDGQWRPLRDRGAVVWTDDFSNLISVLKWHRRDSDVEADLSISRSTSVAHRHRGAPPAAAGAR